MLCAREPMTTPELRQPIPMKQRRLLKRGMMQLAAANQNG